MDNPVPYPIGTPISWSISGHWTLGKITGSSDFNGVTLYSCESDDGNTISHNIPEARIQLREVRNGS